MSFLDVKECLSMLQSVSVIVGVFFVAVQIRQQAKIARADHDRQKRQSTIEFYNKLSSESYKFLDNINKTIKKTDLHTIYDDREKRKNIIRYFSRLERLAVGVASHVYDFKTLNFLAGRNLIEKYKRFKDFIEYARIRKNAPILFMEFERLAKRLEKERKRNPNPIIGKFFRVKQP